MISLHSFPRQQLPFSSKTKEWRKKHLDWSDRKIFWQGDPIRKSFIRKRINYNLVNGLIDLDDMTLVLNPDNVDASYIPENIQHYPILNSKINVLRGEESKRRYDWKCIVTNPNAISEIENTKKEKLFADLQKAIEADYKDDESFNEKINELQYFYTYQWQDMREERANLLLNHYMKELDFRVKFNNGFMDAVTVGEEIYQCDIVGGEPTFERINPMKVHVFKNGYSNRVEDADILVYIDYWSPGRIIDTFYDVLKPADIKYIDEMPQIYYADSMQNIDERGGFVNLNDISGIESGEGAIIDNYTLFAQNTGSAATTNYYDNNGNIRVIRTYWKSKRKIKKIKYYDPETGDEQFDFFEEKYKADKNLGQEEEVLWINEAWEGTKIGKDIYVNMRPRIVQYNKMSNPSKCHFGFVGSIYNINDNKPFSLVDIMKPYAYLYDVLHDRLNKAIAANWGKIVKMDLALIPKGWEVDKWMYYAKVNHIAVVDSFKEGNIGAATGKLAGAMQQTQGVLDLEQGNYIQQHINLLEFIKQEMGEAVGITKQREGQVSASETVGGIERSNLQSSHITEWVFQVHDNVKKRALECFIETAKIALKGKSKKFQYILSDGSLKVVDIDGDEFSESDYGIVMDNSTQTQELFQNLNQLAHAALQNQTLSFSSLMKLMTSPSISEIQRIIEKDEKDIQKRNSEKVQQELQMKQKELEFKKDLELKKIEADDIRNQRDNETKLLIAEIGNSLRDADNIDTDNSELNEKIRQFDEKIGLERDKFEFEKQNSKEVNSINKMKANKKTI